MLVLLCRVFWFLFDDDIIGLIMYGRLIVVMVVWYLVLVLMNWYGEVGSFRVLVVR